MVEKTGLTEDVKQTEQPASQDSGGDLSRRVQDLHNGQSKGLPGQINTVEPLTSPTGAERKINSKVSLDHSPILGASNEIDAAEAMRAELSTMRIDQIRSITSASNETASLLSVDIARNFEGEDPSGNNYTRYANGDETVDYKDSRKRTTTKNPDGSVDISYLGFLQRPDTNFRIHLVDGQEQYLSPSWSGGTDRQLKEQRRSGSDNPTGETGALSGRQDNR